MMQGNRKELAHALPLWGVGAELGVFEGKFSFQLLRRARPKWLYLVDTFTGFVVSGDENGENLRTVDMGSQAVKLRKEFIAEPMETVKALSWEWLAGRKVGELDWVYIDTVHTYETTIKELAAARSAVRKNGVIAGHDFHPGSYPGLVKAVTEFTVRHGLQLEVWCGDKLPSYRILNA